MKELAAWLTAFGLAATGLHLLGVQLPLLEWIVDLGHAIGWDDARFALAAIGIAVFAISAWELQRENL